VVVALLGLDQAADGAVLHSGGHAGILGPILGQAKKNIRPDLDVVKFMRSECTPQT
jgi:hypothetical protein